MKCENCGADYSAKELRCPFCGTVNKTGVAWNAEEEQAKSRVENTRKTVIQSAPMYVTNRVLNAILIVFAVMVVVLFGVTATVFWGEEKIANHKRSKAVYSDVKAMYDAGDYAGVREYLDSYDLDVSSGSVYAPFYEGVQFYEEKQDFMTDWMYYDQKDQAYFERSWKYGRVSDMLETCNQILTENSYRYELDYEENRALQEDLQNTARLFLVSEFAYDEADIERLMTTKTYDDAFDELVRDAYQRKGWAYGVEDAE